MISNELIAEGEAPKHFCFNAITVVCGSTAMLIMPQCSVEMPTVMLILTTLNESRGSLGQEGLQTQLICRTKAHVHFTYLTNLPYLPNKPNLSNSATHLPAYLPTCLHAYMLACLFASMHACSPIPPTYPPTPTPTYTYLLAYLPAYLPIYLPTYIHNLA